MKYLILLLGMSSISLGLTKSVYEMTDEEFKGILGSQDPYLDYLHTKKITHKFNDERDEIPIPPYYDFRFKYPTCNQPVRNQGACGSCWAFAAVEMLEDRFCVADKKHIPNRLSTQYVVGCNNRTIPPPPYINPNFFSDCKGCNGGCAYCAEPFLEEEGTVTENCQPYTSGEDGDDSICVQDKCTVQGETFTTYKCKPDSFIALTDPDLMKKEIIANGPIHTYFMVYKDFKEYQSGIYYLASAEAMGGHCVKIVGWGVEDGMPYWTAQNSWTADWGENGYFRIGFDGPTKFAEMGFACSSTNA